jgi:hypothetical protein
VEDEASELNMLWRVRSIQHTRHFEAFSAADIDASGFVDFDEFCNLGTTRGVSKAKLRQVCASWPYTLHPTPYTLHPKGEAAAGRR